MQSDVALERNHGALMECAMSEETRAASGSSLAGGSSPYVHDSQRDLVHFDDDVSKTRTRFGASPLRALLGSTASREPREEFSSQIKESLGLELVVPLSHLNL